jgi:hypothetical protein
MNLTITYKDTMDIRASCKISDVYGFSEGSEIKDVLSYLLPYHVYDMWIKKDICLVGIFTEYPGALLFHGIIKPEMTLFDIVKERGYGGGDLSIVSSDI